MKDCIINPRTGRHIKASSAAAKKLIKDAMVEIKYVDCNKTKGKSKGSPKDKNTSLYILNPKTGRMVLRSGVLGKKLVAQMEDVELTVINSSFIPIPSNMTSRSLGASSKSSSKSSSGSSSGGAGPAKTSSSSGSKSPFDVIERNGKKLIFAKKNPHGKLFDKLMNRSR